jgi:hypothetical protein
MTRAALAPACVANPLNRIEVGSILDQSRLDGVIRRSKLPVFKVALPPKSPLE